MRRRSYAAIKVCFCVRQIQSVSHELPNGYVIRAANDNRALTDRFGSFGTQSKIDLVLIFIFLRSGVAARSSSVHSTCTLYWVEKECSTENDRNVVMILKILITNVDYQNRIKIFKAIAQC